MAFVRSSIPDFSLANRIYAGATVTVYLADANGERTDDLATLYEAPVGPATLTNPQVLDTDGKWEAPVYIQDNVIAVADLVGDGLGSHETGLISSLGPEVLAAEAAADAAAASATEAEGHAETAEGHADAAAASASAAATSADQAQFFAGQAGESVDDAQQVVDSGVQQIEAAIAAAGDLSQLTELANFIQGPTGYAATRRSFSETVTGAPKSVFDMQFAADPDVAMVFVDGLLIADDQWSLSGNDLILSVAAEVGQTVGLVEMPGIVLTEINQLTREVYQAPNAVFDDLTMPHDLGDVDTTAPFSIENIPITRIDLSRGPGDTFNLGDLS